MAYYFNEILFRWNIISTIYCFELRRFCCCYIIPIPKLLKPNFIKRCIISNCTHNWLFRYRNNMDFDVGKKHWLLRPNTISTCARSALGKIWWLFRCRNNYSRFSGYIISIKYYFELHQTLFRRNKPIGYFELLYFKYFFASREENIKFA